MRRYLHICNQPAFHFVLNLQIAIMDHYRNNGFQIGSGIWCGIAFVIAGGLTMSPGSSSITKLRRVVLTISIMFAAFFVFWAFIAANDYDYHSQYDNKRLRVTQGFFAMFEIILAFVTLCQRTTDQEGHVIAPPQTIVIAPPVAVVAQPIYQPVVQMGYGTMVTHLQPQVQTGFQSGVQTGYQPQVQPQLQAQGYPQTAPPPYTGKF